MSEKRKREDEEETTVVKDEYDDEVEEKKASRRGVKDERRNCPYLDTVNRLVLDFDFEKLCSVSLTNVNVYGCLVCGKYFQGRGKGTHAYFHALHDNHHVFINLETEKVYCLPEMYEVIDSSLDDIKYLLHPTFTRRQVDALDSITQYSRAQDGTNYLPGIVGLNNIKRTDFVNVVVQVLGRVAPFRNFFMIPENFKNLRQPSLLLDRFSELLRKIWNPRNFKDQVSPHEFWQAISIVSNRHFVFNKQADALEFLTWLLNRFHRDLGGTKKPGSSIVHEVFQGEVRITTETPIKSQYENPTADTPYQTSVATSNFLTISLDVPPTPLFKDSQERNPIPQIPLVTILRKFDGTTPTNTMSGERKRFVITKLPKYLIVHVKRFTKNNFFVEKNPTVVNFPVKNLEMRDYIDIQACQKAAGGPISTKYDLLANISHEGRHEDGIYKCHVCSKGLDLWFEQQDLMVRETLPQMVGLAEAYIQIYEAQPLRPGATMEAPEAPLPAAGAASMDVEGEKAEGAQQVDGEEKPAGAGEGEGAAAGEVKEEGAEKKE